MDIVQNIFWFQNILFYLTFNRFFKYILQSSKKYFGKDCKILVTFLIELEYLAQKSLSKCINVSYDLLLNSGIISKNLEITSKDVIVMSWLLPFLINSFNISPYSEESNFHPPDLSLYLLL